jgi:hypothetical protein
VDWDWVVEETSLLDIGGTFTFARGASPEQIMTAFGMNPARARLVPASDVAQALHDPDWLQTYPPEHPWIRVGVAGEWGFALDESSAGYGGYEHAAAAALLASTEVVLVTHTQTIDNFSYCADGALVTMFEPMRGWERHGTEPDRFVEQMRQVGLRTAVGDAWDDAVDPVIAVLQMLTVALGIRVPRDLALGPLLTVQREEAPPRPPAGAPPVAVGAERIRPHVQRLLASGVTADAIAAQTEGRLPPMAIDALLKGVNLAITVRTAEQVLAMQVPPNA